MEYYYSSERNVQILVSLMKAHGVRKIVASPGTTNICFVASVQHDPWFEIFSSADERSAAYIACGLAAESGEPVALSCTGATASRNYLPGLTEAYYRKLPVLAITSSQPVVRIGHYSPQMIDRTNIQNDVANLSVRLLNISNKEDEWACEIAANRALLELRRHGGGPVHINLETEYNFDFSVKELPPVRVINRVTERDALPPVTNGKVGIFVGAHTKWSQKLTEAVDRFCAVYEAVVLCDHTSNYKGKFRVLASLVCSQKQYSSPCNKFDLIIHIGEVSGAYMSFQAKEVWRVSPDGEIRDTYRKLRYVFEMEEEYFFEKYADVADTCDSGHSFLQEWVQEDEKIRSNMSELPFSNIWIAQQTAANLPENSVLHLGILNTLRRWNFFEVPESVLGYSNTGGFGIDGDVSSLIGASLAKPDQLYFGIVGDLAFFYDLNSIGNRHIGKNLRIMLINNGRGTEFRNYSNSAAKFGDDADLYMAAAGHYGNKSHDLIRHYAEDQGYEYLTASNKKEYMQVVGRFTTQEITDQPMLLEVFTDSKDESDALYAIQHLQSSTSEEAKQFVKNIMSSSKKVKGKLGL
ncbi:MAG: 2-succinyl-5-enolpyruvyl-6-hydroxy-3-cyclohexene-1-carboxylate synthase [Ruminococcus sp.]|nr:2-succinyl-5-enolpyruvyl-6-hydroxy-3-cyclohexene-1-carboxylate synthase [Ruminococcus sp.]